MGGPIRLDQVNRRILEILQDDARKSTAEIAREVNRAESTVRERMVTMERIGLIRGYSAILDPFILGYEAHAIVRGSCNFRELDRVVAELEHIPQVLRAVLTTGKSPLIIEIVAENLRQLNTILEMDLAKLDFIDLDPVVVLRDLIDGRRMPLSSTSTLNIENSRRATSDLSVNNLSDLKNL